MPPRRQVKPRSPDHAALGRAVEELRHEAGLTQEELADRINSEFPPVGKLERGVSNPTFSSLLRMARGLGVDLSEVIERFERIRRSSLGD
ncbi:MAG TPA: helix-turn-helix transcriptional regulator [Solirubrobacterales bacterium]|nr:helix-turn-helix transcriptional regulator [Solirubrobacterales bacterium]